MKGVLSKWDYWLCGTWLPLGFLLQLTGFFWLPNTHVYKVWVTNFLLLAALFSLFSRNLLFTLTKSRILLLALLYLCYMSTIPFLQHNPEPEEFIKWSFYIALYLFAIGARLDLNDKQLRGVFLIGAASCAIAIIYACIVDATKHHITQPDYRLTGYAALYNPLMSGHLFGFFFTVSMWDVLQKINQNKISWPTLASATICLAGIILSGSRAPLVASFIVALYMILCVSPKALRIKLMSLCGLLVAVIWFVFRDRLAERGLSLRPEIWTEVIHLWRAHPWLGAGLNADIYIQLNNAIEPIVGTHNITLAALFYGGLIGAFLFWALYGSTFVAGFKMRNIYPQAALASALMLYSLVTLQFDSGNLISRPTECWLLLWLPVALVIRCTLKQERGLSTRLLSRTV